MVQILRPEDGPYDLGAGGLGKVPTLGGDVATSIPPAPSVPSATQTQQSGTTAVQATAQAIVIPPPPYAVIQGLDPSGALGTWFQTLNRKLGGYTAPNTVDIENWNALQDDYTAPAAQVSQDYADMDPRVAALQRQVDDLTWMVMSIAERGWNKQAALTAVGTAAPAGGTGTAAGGWDTAVNRDAAIASMNNTRTRLLDLESRLQALRIL